MRRPRILFLIDHAVDSGGAERFTVGLATHLPSAHYEVWLCATRSMDAAVTGALAGAGVRHLVLGRRTKWDVHRLAALARLLRQERIDILHSHMFGSNLWAALLGHRCGVPIVIAHEHTWSFEGRPLRKLVDGRVIGRRVDRFVAVSRADARRMVELEHVPAEKVVVLPTAYVPRPHGTGGDLRSELGLAADTPLVGTVAQLRTQKTLHILLEAFVEVLHAQPDAHLVIVGRGPCRADLEAYAGKLHIAHRTHFLGYRQDIDSILSALDVAALSSDYEGTPLAAFECFINRTPLVTTSVGGLPDIIDHGRNGLLVPRRQPQALAEAVIAVLQDRDLAARLAAAGAANLEQFTMPAVTRRFEALYSELLGGQPQSQEAPCLT
jgi:glycosyltransferase involved in cell wall biosynthesis